MIKCSDGPRVKPSHFQCGDYEFESRPEYIDASLQQMAFIGEMPTAVAKHPVSLDTGVNVSH